MDHQSDPAQPGTPISPTRPTSRPEPPAAQRINVVPHGPAGSGPPGSVTRDGADRLWVSASGLWPPLHLTGAAVAAGAYRVGCGRHHDPAEPCGVVDCHGQAPDDADPTYQQVLGQWQHQCRQLDDLTQRTALLALRLIGYTVHRADPEIAYVCLDWSDEGDYLRPGVYRAADRGERPDGDLSDRLDAAITEVATSLCTENERTWFPFTTDYQTLSSASGGELEPDVWLDVAELLTATQPGGAG